MALAPESSPLTHDEWAIVDRAGVRLGSELRLAIGALPLEARANARLLARALGLDLALCQSVLDALHALSDGLKTAALLPGKVATLRFVRGLERKLGRKIETLAVAAEQYAMIVDSLATTNAAATARLEATLKDPTPAMDHARRWHATRQASFEALCKVADAWSDSIVDVSLLQIDGTDPNLMMETSVTSQRGLRTRGMGYPISSKAWLTGRDSSEFHPQEGTVRDQSRPLLVKEFSTYPLPIMSSRDEGGGNLSLIDISLDSTLESVDVAQERVASRVPVPNDEDPLWSGALSSRIPARRLVSTYFLPRSMAERSIVSGAGYFWTPALSGDPARHWHEQLAGVPSVERLGSDLSRAAHPDVPKLGRMSEYLFARCGVSPEEYAGFRLDVEYPVWGAVYYITFDFRA